MTCSKKYMDLVVTVDGLTPDNPAGLVASNFDYSEWRELAGRLGIRAQIHLERLKELNKSEESTERSNQLIDEFNALVQQIDGLPSFWSLQTTLSAIGQAVSASTQAACLLEAIDKEIKAAGGTPPSEPVARKSATEVFDFASIVNVAIVAGLAYAAFRVVKATS